MNNLELNVVKLKKGYRWRVYKTTNGVSNLFCTGTDYHATEREAENEAIRTFCESWTLCVESDSTGGDNERQT